MKILAIEKEKGLVQWENQADVLLEEARSVYRYMLSGVLREIYFTQHKNAVLIMECTNRSEAVEVLNTLPLVQKGLIEFEVMELHPYTGLSRLMKGMI